ncbi:MAG: ribonuclease Y [Chloroflexi bacterium]|nr:ribonuclease Y [Chloroflexota bacterium]
MEIVVILLAVVLSLTLGGAVGFLMHTQQVKRTATAAGGEAERILAEAEDQRKKIVADAREEASQVRRSTEDDLKGRRKELQRFESRLATREEGLDKRQEKIQQQGDSISDKEQAIIDRESALDRDREEVEELKGQQIKVLESVASLTMVEAKEDIMHRAEEEMHYDLNKRYYEMEQEIKDQADDKAKEIVSLAIQRLAADVVSESTTSSVPLPNDEMKGRLIGREGRNIRALEAATGVDLIIDDTPEAVTISCFDPVRREVARLALTKLVSDGRIHPARIEETVEKAQQEVEESMRKAGDQAIIDAGVRGLHPELIKLLGRLKYRYSYGENILQHAVQVSQIAGMLAAEVGADVQVAKAGGLLHDIGKAMTHEVEGSHVEIGDEIAKRYNLPDAVRDAVNEHHEDDRGSAEAFLVAAADAMSAARPGARRDTLEFYLKRLEALEDVANSFEGVEKSFAIQAGREIRIMVKPEDIDDIEAASLARNVVKKIEENLVYPAAIKVTVIRETRSVDYAK